MDVGKRIIYFRNRQKITTNKLADLAGVSQSYLREIELGNVSPTIEKLEYICEALQISMEEFFKDESKENIINTLSSLLNEDEAKELLKFITLIKDR